MKTLAPWERRWFRARSMYRVFHKAHTFNMLSHGVTLTSACRTKVRTNDLQSEQLPALVRYATVWKFPSNVTLQRENLGQFHLKTGLAYVLVRMIVGPPFQ